MLLPTVTWQQPGCPAHYKRSCLPPPCPPAPSLTLSLSPLALLLPLSFPLLLCAQQVLALFCPYSRSPCQCKRLLCPLPNALVTQHLDPGPSSLRRHVSGQEAPWGMNGVSSFKLSSPAPLPSKLPQPGCVELLCDPNPVAALSLSQPKGYIG